MHSSRILARSSFIVSRYTAEATATLTASTTYMLLSDSVAR